MKTTIDTDENRLSAATPRAVGAAFVIIALLVTIDVILDLQEGATLLHVSGESLIVLVAVVGLAMLAQQARAERRALTAELAEIRGKSEQWRHAAMRWEREAGAAVRAFSDAVDQEFDRWSLTTSERDIALLLLKGMSMKEIAVARGTSERTVRQQAVTVYGKANVEGRAQLASYFLDSLSPPSTAAEATPNSSG